MTCQLKRWNSCCCQCANHLRDHSHPSTNGGPVTHQRGWICYPPLATMAFSDWPAHGMCEIFREKK